MYYKHILNNNNICTSDTTDTNNINDKTDNINDKTDNINNDTNIIENKINDINDITNIINDNTNIMNDSTNIMNDNTNNIKSKYKIKKIIHPDIDDNDIFNSYCNLPCMYDETINNNNKIDIKNNNYDICDYEDYLIGYHYIVKNN
jgi:hypothetical protein